MILVFAAAFSVFAMPLHGDENIVMTSGVALHQQGLPRIGRGLLNADPVQSAVINGRWQAPSAGERFPNPENPAVTDVWVEVRANTNGWFEPPAMRGGDYFYTTVNSRTERVMVLVAQGDSMVFVNGEPHAGDLYQYGYLKIPILLKAGINEFLFQCGRGRLRSELVEPKGPLFFDLSDPTLPDLVAGQRPPTWGAIVAINATTNWQRNLLVTSQIDRGKSLTTMMPAIPPLSSRKLAIQIEGRVIRTNDPGTLHVALIQRDRHRDNAWDKTETKLRIRTAEQTRRVTFQSQIDGSVQYYALKLAKPAMPEVRSPALFLALHGASVEASGHVDAYSSKTWGHIVGPSNRRPYGYDWEDWGRMDALEVLELAQRTLQTDPQRVYLTGHSMGGHGTWHIGGLYPDRFAAIGPSAGWISFQNLGGRRTNAVTRVSPVEKLFNRASNIGDTFGWGTNFLHQGVYIVHGDADDNVPVGQARAMRDYLTKFHHDFLYHEQRGAGHWWEASDEPGAECVDWAPMFDLFAKRSIPDLQSVRHVQFTTANPGVSSTCDWVAIESQLTNLEPSHVDIQLDPWSHRFIGKTFNVARLRLDLESAPKAESLRVELDGQPYEKIPWPAKNHLWFERRSGIWIPAREVSKADKGPQRYGPFKEAFQHRMIFVYATHGTPEENAWAFAKARFDAESFYYRGNGAVDILPDSEFNPNTEPDRCVILYGNADSNRAWDALLSKSPVQVHRGSLSVNGREKKGSNLACVFLRPRPGSNIASVAVVSGTGAVGQRAADRLPYLSPGIEFPDLTVVSANTLPGPLPSDGRASAPSALSNSTPLVCAGFFGSNWSLDTGEVVWQE